MLFHFCLVYIDFDMKSMFIFTFALLCVIYLFSLLLNIFFCITGSQQLNDDVFFYCFICIYIVWLSLSFLALWTDSFHQIWPNLRPLHFQIFSHSCHLFLISITNRSPQFSLLTYLFYGRFFSLYGSVYLLRNPYIFMFT